MTDFNLKFEDVLLERPLMVGLIEAAIKGSFQGVDVDAAFKGLKPAQEKYFARLLTKIWTKGLKKQAKKRAIAAKALVDAEMAAKSKELPVWRILPRKEDVEATK